MGYDVRIEDHDEITLYIDNEAEAFRRFIEMSTKYDHLKNGGSPNQRWFSWMNDYETECNEADDVLEYLGFDTECNDNGCVITGYNSKMGQEELFINEIADLVSPGTINWVGEDGERWRWVFDGVKMRVDNQVPSWKTQD